MIWMDVDTAIASAPVNACPLIDDTDFKTIEAAVAFNAAGLALFWNFVTTAGVMTQTAVTPTSGGDYDWTDLGTGGMYAIEIPASAGASINNNTEGFGWFTGVATGVLPWAGPIIGFRAAGLNNKLVDDAYSTTRGLAGTALPDAAADAAGGVPISDAGGLDLDARLDAAITSRLAPTTAGRTLDVTATGAAGLDWGNVENPTTAVNLSATNIDVDQIVASVSGAVGSVTGNVDGNVTGTVGGFTAAAKAEIQTEAEDAIVAHRLDEILNADSDIDGAAPPTVGSVVHEMLSKTAGSFTYDQATDSNEALRDRGDAAWTTATGFSTHSAADVWAVATRTLTAFDASFKTGYALSAAGVQAIWDALTSALTTVGSIGKLLVDNVNATISSRLSSASYTTPPTVGQIADQVWEEAIADHSGTVGSTAEQLAAAGSAGDPWATALPGAYSAGQAGKIVGDNLNATVGSRATQTSVDDVPTNAELTTALAAADDAVLAAIAALNNLSAAQVNAEVVDALATDTYAEPSAVLAATASLKDKINFLATLARNKVQQTATTQTLKADNGTTNIGTAAVSDDGTTFERGEWQ